MDKYEEISFILSDYYSYVEQFFVDIIKQRLEIPNYENRVLTSKLTNVKRKLNKSDSEELSCDRDEDGSGLDLDLYRLDRTICYGTRAYHKKYCEGFNLIFSDIDLSQYQDADSKITDILAEVKAFEFLARYHFSNITRLEKKTSQHAIEFTAHRNNKNYCVSSTSRFSSKCRKSL